MDASTLASLVRDYVDERARLLIMGVPGSSTPRLAAPIADAIARAYGVCQVIIADPADAEIGPTTAIAIASRRDGQWVCHQLEGLSTLDGARFRGPLAVAVAKLANLLQDGPLLVCLPSVVRGVAALELPAMIAQACAATAAVVVDSRQTRPLEPSLRAMCVPILWAKADGSRVSESQKREAWARQWREYMAKARPCRWSRQSVDIVGLPPPEDAALAWEGRVAALLDVTGHTLCLGEIQALHDGIMQVLAPCEETERVHAICVRDAAVDPAEGMPVTAAPSSTSSSDASLRARLRSSGRAFELPVLGPAQMAVEIPPLGHKGEIVCDLVNGVFGDPLLHVRMVAQRRSLLFDIGEATRLPRRIAHQITHVFVSHAHMDHVAGLVWLVRMRIGDNGTCHLVGPPGLARQLSNQLGVFTWNLVEGNGPRFKVDEVHGEEVRRFNLQCGVVWSGPCQSRSLRDDVVWVDGEICVRAATVDHNTPVLAYRLQQAAAWRVRQERLQALGEPAGPWLGELKRAAQGQALAGTLVLPSGREVDKQRLVSDLLVSSPGQILSYVTDVADRAENFRRLTSLVEGSDILVCEAGFSREDRDRARASAHFTTEACARLARAAGVRVLVPFHFSARYEGCEDKIYDEIRAGFDGTLVPGV